MLLHSPLSTVTPTVDADVLTVLAGADDWFTVSRIHGLTPNRSREGIRKTLVRLSDQGVVDSATAGSTRSYRLNREHLAAPAILELASLRTILFTRLTAVLEGWSPRPMFAAVFGSAARGIMSPTSDIDLFLLHPGSDTSDWDALVDDLTDRAGRWTGNTVNPLILTRDEAQASSSTEPVVTDIAEVGIPLLGSFSRFRRLAGAAR